MIQRFSKVLYVTLRKLGTAAGYLPSLQRLSSTTAEAKYGDKLRRKAEEWDMNCSLLWLVSYIFQRLLEADSLYLSSLKKQKRMNWRDADQSRRSWRLRQRHCGNHHLVPLRRNIRQSHHLPRLHERMPHRSKYAPNCPKLIMSLKMPYDSHYRVSWIFHASYPFHTRPIKFRPFGQHITLQDLVVLVVDLFAPPSHWRLSNNWRNAVDVILLSSCPYLEPSRKLRLKSHMWKGKPHMSSTIYNGTFMQAPRFHPTRRFFSENLRKRLCCPILKLAPCFLHLCKNTKCGVLSPPHTWWWHCTRTWPPHTDSSSFGAKLRHHHLEETGTC